jgi:hypothetical protein
MSSSIALESKGLVSVIGAFRQQGNQADVMRSRR